MATTALLHDLAEPPEHVIAIVSGGLDSTTMAFALHAMGARVSAVSFDYGQRHRVELAAARAVTQRLGLAHHVIDLRSVGAALSGSALTDRAVAVPHGQYTDDSMRCTVVPNRNAIMLDIATGIAVAEHADAVAFGAHGGDHAIYPDCRPAFTTAFAETARIGNAGFLHPRFRVLAPLLAMSKADVVRTGATLSVPFELTWSCYEGGRFHCGACGTCVERREAFSIAGIADPTRYDHPMATAGTALS